MRPEESSNPCDARQIPETFPHFHVDLLRFSERFPLPPVKEILRLLVTRERLEQAADTIIEFLDHLDGDPDDEPSLGSIGNTAECLSLDQRRWALGGRIDLEQDADVV